MALLDDDQSRRLRNYLITLVVGGVVGFIFGSFAAGGLCMIVK